MNRIAMSSAASALLRALIARAVVSRDRILLTDAQSTDWCSLTLSGERHQITLRMPPPASTATLARMCEGIEDFEFDIAGSIVADIGVMACDWLPDGSVVVTIEALTISES